MKCFKFQERCVKSEHGELQNMIEIKDHPNKWRNISCSWNRRLNIVGMSFIDSV